MVFDMVSLIWFSKRNLYIPTKIHENLVHILKIFIILCNAMLLLRRIKFPCVRRSLTTVSSFFKSYFKKSFENISKKRKTTKISLRSSLSRDKSACDQGSFWNRIMIWNTNINFFFAEDQSPYWIIYWKSTSFF